IVATALLAAIGFISTFLLVTRARRADAGDTNWETAFHLARASFLFVGAAVPAIACFLAAYNFEMTLVDKHDQAVLSARLAARHDRINARAMKFQLCDARQKPETCAGKIDDFIEARTVAGGASQPWDVPVVTPVAHSPATGDAGP